MICALAVFKTKVIFLIELSHKILLLMCVSYGLDKFLVLLPGILVTPLIIVS